jgi:hypothetical protein
MDGGVYIADKRLSFLFIIHLTNAVGLLFLALQLNK